MGGGTDKLSGLEGMAGCGKARMEKEARAGYIISLSFHAEALSFGSSRERNECVTRPFR